ncbi:MAG: Bax inhibitor-1 family protein [Gemmatimonadaceae bacterium]
MGLSYSAAPAAVRTGSDRATLVRRTYSLVLASVVVTMAGAAFGLSQPSLMRAVAEHRFITFLCMLAPLFLAMRARRTFPANIGLTLLFTFVEGVWISPILWFYSTTMPGVLSQAAILTLGTFGVLTGFAFVSRRDFSALGSFLSVGLWVLIGTMLLNYFFGNATGGLWLSAVGLLIFSGFVIYDTWKIRNVYGPEDYVQAAVNIYLDLLNMFLFILNLLGRKR